ncbi:MAG: hypothetical protein WD691_11805 [Acidimicrobiales bacterium]
MVDEFDPDEVAQAERLDGDISRALTGAVGTDTALTWLVASVRTDPPAALATRITVEHERRERARWRPAQLVAGLFALNLLSHGLGNMFVGEWVSRGLGEHYSPHAVREGGFALIAAGLAVGAGALRRSWLPVSVGAGVPLGLALGIYGLPEIGKFGQGAALHITQGLLAIVLGLSWWRARRYGNRPHDEGGA